MKIVDLSKYNVVTDWKLVQMAVSGVIIRCGYRSYASGKIIRDPKADKFAKACTERGISMGFYFLSQAITVAEAVEEANFAVGYAQKYGATMPVFMDSEDGDGTDRVVRADGLSPAERTAIAKEFCNTVNAAGYIGGVYASESWFTSHLDYEGLRQFYIWVANYGENTGEISGRIELPKWDMYQYTSKGSVPGISGNVDLSVRREAEESQMQQSVSPQLTEQSVAQSQPQEQATRYFLPTIKKGSQGKAVKIWQIIIGETSDGIFGVRTDAGTRKWQEQHGLAVDGIVGKNTWSEGLQSLA